jgi:TolA-binding protein
VLLRLRGQAPIGLAAGQAWTLPSTARNAPSAASPPLGASTASATGTASPAPARALLVQPAPSSSARALASPSGSASAAAEDFRAAVAAFNGGRSNDAATQLARFLTQYPGDARAEDAAYLRVLALRQAGDGAAAKAAAQDYLRRYPSGFRRTEVEKLAR